MPSDVFKDRVVTCFIDDPAGVQMRHLVGLDSICWESDYPHSDSTWPVSPETLAESLNEVPDEEIDRITHLNAMRHYRFDPFSVTPRQACTVGALRARAKDVDVTPRPGASNGAHAASAAGTEGDSAAASQRAAPKRRLTKASDLTGHPGTNR